MKKDEAFQNTLNEATNIKPVDKGELADSSVSKVNGGSVFGFNGEEYGTEYGAEYGSEYGTEYKYGYEEPYTSTKMVCQKCGHFAWWRGDRVGRSDDCSCCGGKGTFLGVELQRG